MEYDDKYINEVIKEWKNKLEPIPQFSDKINILQIDYNQKEVEIMNIFRAIILSKKISLKVYELTSIVISFFPTNYMAWVVRRQCLDKIKEIDHYQELSWLDNLLVPNQKNYQIWQHRKLLIDKLDDPSHEKYMLDIVFKFEPKNFHAWTHRIWMIRRFNNVEGEFEFIEKMLKNDIKNNSVWNYRFFLVMFTNNNNLDKNIIQKEIELAVDKIKSAPKNECPFCYIRGYITKFGHKYNDFPFVKEELEKILDENKNNSYILMLLMDYYEDEKNENKFNEMIDKLVECDYIRKKYYFWRKNNSVFKKMSK